LRTIQCYNEINDRFGKVTNNQGNNNVNDRFEKAKNNPMVAIMLMIDLYKLKNNPTL
jgi:hypothetical protein